METFEKTVNKYIDILEQYVPVVAKVHGDHHPEFHQVKTLFDKIKNDIENNELSNLNLEIDFKKLRAITDNYTVPADTCETYEAVYNMLSKLDNAYKR